MVKKLFELKDPIFDIIPWKGFKKAKKQIKSILNLIKQTKKNHDFKLAFCSFNARLKHSKEKGKNMEINKSKDEEDHKVQVYIFLV